MRRDNPGSLRQCIVMAMLSPLLVACGHDSTPGPSQQSAAGQFIAPIAVGERTRADYVAPTGLAVGQLPKITKRTHALGASSKFRV